MKIIYVLVGLGIIAAGYYFLTSSSRQNAPLPEPQAQAFDGRNSTFMIDGKEVTLAQGVSEVSIPDSSAKITTRYVGNETIGDLMGNGNNDIAYFVTQETGGSGTFYYVVVAYKTESGYKTTNAFLVGDRILPETLYIPMNSRELHVNYTDRKKDEPMTALPTQKKVLLLKVTPDGRLEGLMK